MMGLLNTAIHQFAKKQMTFFRTTAPPFLPLPFIP